MKGQNKYWDGYQGEEYVLLDDLDCGSMGHNLKIWGDRYSFLADVDGETILIRPRRMIVTSLYAPDDQVFKWDCQMSENIRRKFKVIKMESKEQFTQSEQFTPFAN
jgi:hypothetical protein